MTLTPNIGVRGIWDFEQAEINNLDTDFAKGTNKPRTRTVAGLTANLQSGTRLTLDEFYDGAGVSNFEAYGVKVGINLPIK